MNVPHHLLLLLLHPTKILAQKYVVTTWLAHSSCNVTPEPWYKDIKLLGSKLDTKKDVAARKAKVWQPFQKMRHFFKSKRLSTQHKVKIYKTYIETTLLYNAKTWTLTKTLEDNLNAFQRRLLRITLNIKYPKIISNQKLYNITKEIPLTERIKKTPRPPRTHPTTKRRHACTESPPVLFGSTKAPSQQTSNHMDQTHHTRSHKNPTTSQNQNTPQYEFSPKTYRNYKRQC